MAEIRQKLKNSTDVMEMLLQNCWNIQVHRKLGRNKYEIYMTSINSIVVNVLNLFDDGRNTLKGYNPFEA